MVGLAVSLPTEEVSRKREAHINTFFPSETSMRAIT